MFGGRIYGIAWSGGLAVQTLKTALVVVLLLFVIYGAFVAINGSNTALNPEIADMVDLDTNTPDIGGVTGPFLSSSSSPTQPTPGAGAPAADPWAQFQSKPTSGFNAPAAIPTEPALGATPPALPTSTEASGSNVANGPNIPSLDTSDLPPLPPLPPIISSDSIAKETSTTSPSENASTLPALPTLPSDAIRSPTPDNAVSEKDVANTQTPDFGLAIPSGPNANASAKPASESPSLNAMSSLPSPSMLPKLPDAGPALSDARTSSSASPAMSSRAYDNAKAVAMDQATKGQLKDALATMSVFYNSAELTESQRTDLLDFLDALAAQVIYSTEHYLDLPYTSAAGETLEQIARRFQVPTEVLARINGLEPSAVLQSGTKLKVVPGPFRAEVDLNRNELTLFLGELYASRFPISTGSDPNPQPGSYSVVAKDRNRNYYSAGAQIMASDPNNPYGGYLIDLGNQVSIHGSSGSGNDKLGCISLSPADVADVYGMLSSGSQVTIRR